MPPRTSRRHKQGAESRERILEAALEIAAERGYDGTTIALVCEATGLPASSVYWHFTNKDALLAEVLEHSYSRWRSGEDAFEATDVGDVRDRFAARFERVRLGLEEQPEFWRLGLMLALLSGPDEIAARTRFLQVRQATLDATVEWCADVDRRRRPWPAIPTSRSQLDPARDGRGRRPVHGRAERPRLGLRPAHRRARAGRPARSPRVAAEAPKSRARRRTPATGCRGRRAPSPPTRASGSSPAPPRSPPSAATSARRSRASASGRACR